MSDKSLDKKEFAATLVKTYFELCDEHPDPHFMNAGRSDLIQMNRLRDAYCEKFSISHEEFQELFEEFPLSAFNEYRISLGQPMCLRADTIMRKGKGVNTIFIRDLGADDNGDK